jgi:hypothetical protein
MSTMEQRILEELVYDRVRSTVNLCQLVIVEQELDESVQRALARPGAGAGADLGAGAGAGADGTAVPGRKPGELAREHMQRAWERLEREWNRLRKDLARAECAGCPGCAEGACDAP